MKPIIGLVGRLYSGDSNIICVEEVRKAITNLGGIPLLILPVDKVDINTKNSTKEVFYNNEEINDLKNILDLCDGFILPGGDTWYHLDEVIINYAIKKDIPLLGICLGMQTLSKVLSNDKRTSYDNTIRNNTYINHFEVDKKYVHKVNIKENSKLYSIIGKSEILVNSRHNYHTPLINNNYISAISEDGVVEGVEDPYKSFILGVQWHPETFFEEDINSRKILSSFISSCLKNSQKFHKKSL